MILNRDLDAQLQSLVAGTDTVLPLDALRSKLLLNRPLIIKLGVDPTAKDLHLGHAVVLSKLRQFQDFGHQAIFLIGDFTTKIGDPTGRSKTRPTLTDEEILENAQTYLTQAGKILDTKKIIIRKNSEWLSCLQFADIVRLCSLVTAAHILDRDDFKARLNNHQPLSFHELLYPLMQGYDSVALRADVELGGTDQTFNLLMGRHLQQQKDQEAQVIMTMPILPGLDGVVKMSKSMNNHIGLTETPENAFGKLMSISDSLMFVYAQALLFWSNDQIAAYQSSMSSGALHPMDMKKTIAQAIVDRFWGREASEQGRCAFEALFQKDDYSYAESVSLSMVGKSCWIVDILRELKVIETSSQARRLIEGKAVEVNQKVIVDFKELLILKPGDVVRVGKKKLFSIAAA